MQLNAVIVTLLVTSVITAPLEGLGLERIDQKQDGALLGPSSDQRLASGLLERAEATKPKKSKTSTGGPVTTKNKATKSGKATTVSKATDVGKASTGSQASNAGKATAAPQQGGKQAWPYKDSFEACNSAKNCEVYTNARGEKAVRFKKGWEPGTKQGDAFIKKPVAIAADDKKGDATSTNGKTGKKNNAKTTVSSDTKRNLEVDQIPATRVTRADDFEAYAREFFREKRDAPEGYHYVTNFRASDKSIVYGCADPGEIKPEDIIKLIKSQCPVPGPCITNPETPPATKIFYVHPSPSATAIGYKDGMTLQLNAAGHYFDQTERDGFIDTVAGYSTKVKRTTQAYGIDEASIPPKRGLANHAALNSTMASAELPSLVRRDGATVKPSDIPVGSGDHSTCELVQGSAGFSFDRYTVKDGEPGDHGLATTFTVDLKLDAGSQVDFCAFLSPILSGLGGLVPVVGAEVAGIVGTITAACSV